MIDEAHAGARENSISEGDPPASDALAGIVELEEAVAQLMRELDVGFSVKDGEADAVEACYAFLRAILLHGQSTIILVRQNRGEAASANVRAMFEAWMQLLFVVTAEDRASTAQRARIFAVLEVLESPFALGTRPELRDIQNRALDKLAADYPDALADARLQRAGKVQGRSPKYWTGMSPTALVDLISKRFDMGDVMRTYYKWSSYDAHHVLAVPLGVRRVKHDAGITIMMADPNVIPDAVDFSCHVAAGVVKLSVSAMEAYGLIERKPT